MQFTRSPEPLKGKIEAIARRIGRQCQDWGSCSWLALKLVSLSCTSIAVLIGADLAPPFKLEKCSPLAGRLICLCDVSQWRPDFWLIRRLAKRNLQVIASQTISLGFPPRQQHLDLLHSNSREFESARFDMFTYKGLIG